MPLIEQSIPSLVGGVSQRPQAQRRNGQAEAQTNALNHPSRGLSKRPPLAHFAQLASDVTGLDQGFVHSIDLSPTERFLAVVRSNGALAVFDKATGTAVTVTTVGVDSYLTPVPETVVREIDLTGVNGDLLAAFVAGDGYGFLKWSTEPNTQFRSYNNGNVSWGNATVPIDVGYRYKFPLPVADYTVSSICRWDAPNFVSDYHQVIARGNLTNKACYSLTLNGNGDWALTKLDAAGSSTPLSSATIGGFNINAIHTFGLQVAGTNITPIIDGVLKTPVVDATIAAAGYAGIGGSGGGDNNGADGVATRAIMSRASITYIAPTASGPAPLKAAQAGKQTVIANATVKVERGATTAPNKVYQALVAVRQADFGTVYSLTLDGETVSMGSPEGVTPQARTEIDTTNMAKQLKALINGSSPLAGFTVTQYGSTLLVAKTDGSDFAISVDDGLADNGLLVIKGTVQQFTDLPAKAPSGFTVEVTGSAESEFDNYFVRFDVTDAATNAGVWKECVKPGEQIALKAATMPHVLTYKGSVLPESQSAGTPPLPTIVPGGGTLQREVWDALFVLLGARGHMKKDGDNYPAVINAANGISTEYTAFYDVDTRRADPENLAEITLKAETGAGTGVFVEIARKTYGPEFFRNNDSITGTYALAAGAKLNIGLQYTLGVSPAEAKMADFYPHSFNNTTYPAIQFYKRTGKVVTFDPARVYPQGALIRITCDGVNFDYTPATDVTGAAAAIQLKTQIDAHVTFVATNPISGQILVTRADLADTVVSAAITWSELTTFHDPALAQTASALIGKTVKNLTDNSEGIVTANTPTTLSVAALTGGADNKFQKGDKIQVLNAGVYFTFGPATWTPRAAGDLTSNPMPSLVDQKINDVLITKGRLGFVSGGNIVLSEVGDLFNLFRTTVTQLLDGDPIDVKPAHGEAVRFHSYFAWDGRDIFASRRHQFELSGDPILSPRTVKLLPISEYPMDAIRPVVLGRYAYFVAKREDFTQVWSYGIESGAVRPQAAHMTKDQSQYLAGDTLLIAGDADLGVLAVLTDADRSQLYVHTFDDSGAAWTRWQFPAGTSVFGMSFLDGVLTVLSKRSDGAYLDTLDVDFRTTIGLLDRRTSPVGVFSAGSTTWTLPYSCATNGSEGTIVVMNASTGAVITSTRPLATTVAAVGDFSAVGVVIGITYTLSHTLSTIYQRNSRSEANEAITSGRLQLRRLKLFFEDSRDFTVTVTPAGRTARAYPVVKTVDTDGFLSVPIDCRNQDVSIVITNSLPRASRLTDATWEGFAQSRGQRV